METSKSSQLIKDIMHLVENYFSENAEELISKIKVKPYYTFSDSGSVEIVRTDIKIKFKQKKISTDQFSMILDNGSVIGPFEGKMIKNKKYKKGE